MDSFQLDLETGAPLPRRGEHERRCGEVLHGHADRLVQRNLRGVGPAGTCAGATQSSRTTGSAEWVVAATTSAPRTASSKEPAAVTPSSSASERAFAASRPATRISLQSRIRAKARACDRAWTPVPRMASTHASSRASSRAASAAAAAVRVAVMCVPSISASGVPFSGSKSMIAA